MRDARDRAVVARRTGTLFHVARVDDEALREPEDLARQREVLRPRLPQRGDAVVEHAVGEQPAGQAVVALHRRQVARRVATGECDSCDKVMKDELVKDDDAGPAAQRLDDPAVRVRVVPYVVEGDVGLRSAAESAGARDLDVDPLLQRGEQQRAVVGDARARRRERRVVGDLHARRRSMARSQVSCSAT